MNINAKVLELKRLKRQIDQLKEQDPTEIIEELMQKRSELTNEQEKLTTEYDLIEKEKAEFSLKIKEELEKREMYGQKRRILEEEVRNLLVHSEAIRTSLECQMEDYAKYIRCPVCQQLIKEDNPMVNQCAYLHSACNQCVQQLRCCITCKREITSLSENRFVNEQALKYYELTETLGFLNSFDTSTQSEDVESEAVETDLGLISDKIESF